MVYIFIPAVVELFVEVERGADQTQVRECLWKIAEVFTPET